MKECSLEAYKEFDFVSRETIQKLQHYHAMLVKWQKTINLVSPNTLSEAWERHFVDSLQLLLHIDREKETSWVDIGSGAGFPALVVAIVCPNIAVTMIESDMRKSLFLKNVIRECGVTNAIVINQNLNDVEGLTFDVISARALASLDKLMDWSKRFVDWNKDDTKGIFLKGMSWQNEWDSIKSEYSNLTVDVHPSITNSEAAILVFQKST